VHAAVVETLSLGRPFLVPDDGAGAEALVLPELHGRVDDFGVRDGASDTTDAAAMPVRRSERTELAAQWRDR
jgi:hypothetical protein